MKRDETVYLKDILESIERIEEYKRGINRKKFLENPQIQDSIIRRLEIIGEAVKNLSKGFREEHPQVEWKKISGTRDILIHSYFGVNLERVWNLIELDLPKLKKEIEKILRGWE
ncbi:MAG: DUF86 domain-containing protein [Candidatus Aenigmatarchaeota archaeon]